MRIALASDHAGFSCKELVKKKLEESKIKYKDFGTYSDESVDYPDFVHPACRAIENKEFEIGILFCGSANGVSITANKYRGIRSAICWEKKLAELARKHNDANVLSIPCRFISQNLILEIVDIFLTTNFEGGRHTERVNKITNR